jgi:hypothetical protein
MYLYGAVAKPFEIGGVTFEAGNCKISPDCEYGGDDALLMRVEP